MHRFAVGMPTCNRYDLADACLASVLASTINPERIVVIDNGGGYQCKNCNVEVNTQTVNGGIAKAWNLIRSLTAPLDLIILNDDLVLSPNVLQCLMDSPTQFSTAAGLGWSCFKQRNSVWEAVGLYDEEFFAYHEDNDYSYRMKLAGIERDDVQHGGIAHVGSATVNAMIGHNRSVFEQNWFRGHVYYICKWGGTPDKETFKTPFNR